MTRITTSVLALSLVGATSCVAYDNPGYQNPPGSAPDHREQPGGYQSPPPPPSGNYQQPYQQPYDSGYNDPYQRSPSYEVGFFYQELSPYGEWVFTYDYGWAWYPRYVQAGWRPYYYGHWVPCDYGWMWVSNEPFGWATYHYGRWAWDVRLGWIWVPGRTWGPAWVSWQSGQGYTGWAPLPPEVGFEVGFGLRIGGFSLSVGIQPQNYVFVQDHLFLEPDPYRYAQPTSRNVTIIQNTTNITNYTYVDNRVINKGVDFQQVERATGKRVRPLRVAESTSEKVDKVSGDQVTVYKAPRERIETVKVDDSKPRNKGIGRDRERPDQKSQMERREQAPPSQGSKPAPQAQDQRRTPRAQDDQKMRSNPPADLEVAPRAQQEAKAENEEQVRHKQEKEQQELRAYQREEQQRLEQAQREEKQKAKDKAQAELVDKQHAAERQALVQEQQQAEQQLQAKQEAERKAVKAKPPGKQKADEKKAKEQDKGKKKPQAEEPPPPHR